MHMIENSLSLLNIVPSLAQCRSATTSLVPEIIKEGKKSNLCTVSFISSSVLNFFPSSAFLRGPRM